MDWTLPCCKWKYSRCLLYWQLWVAPEEAVEVGGVNENSEYQSSAVLWVSAVAHVSVSERVWLYSGLLTAYLPLGYPTDCWLSREEGLPNILVPRVYFEEWVMHIEALGHFSLSTSLPHLVLLDKACSGNKVHWGTGQDVTGSGLTCALVQFSHNHLVWAGLFWCLKIWAGNWKVVRFKAPAGWIHEVSPLIPWSFGDLWPVTWSWQNQTNPTRIRLGWVV